MEGASFPSGTAPVAVGDVLAGKYRVERILGVGGMGVVVAATHVQLGQLVALKFMLVAGAGNGALLERFAREARAAVRLRSDHVARVLDVGTLASGSPYMVMEYLDGSDLGDVVERQGPLPVEGAVDCVLQACDAVAEAHSLGIVHRDLKPRNLFLTYRNDGRPLVKVLDFGISKHKTAPADLSLTRTTEVIGSPNYMSPEQFRAARAADERSDIWALGVILYELLSGQVPFLADTVTQLTVMVLTEPPRPIQALRADVPPELVPVIHRCLEKDPAARFQTVADLASALQRFAPPDTRELATRIARIGSARSKAGSAGASPPSGERLTPASGGGSSSGKWSSTPVETRDAPPRATLPITMAALVGAAALAGGFIALRGAATHVRHPRSDGSPASAVSREAIVAAPSSAPIFSAATNGADAGESPEGGAVGLAPASATARAGVVAGSASPLASAPSAARSRAAPARTVNDAGAPDDPPRYRTNW